MKEKDYIESFIEKYYKLNKNLEEKELSKYLESNGLYLDNSSLEKRIDKFKKNNGGNI